MKKKLFAFLALAFCLSLTPAEAVDVTGTLAPKNPTDISVAKGANATGVFVNTSNRDKLRRADVWLITEDIAGMNITTPERENWYLRAIPPAGKYVYYAIPDKEYKYSFAGVEPGKYYLCIVDSKYKNYKPGIEEAKVRENFTKAMPVFDEFEMIHVGLRGYKVVEVTIPDAETFDLGLIE